MLDVTPLRSLLIAPCLLGVLAVAASASAAGRGDSVAAASDCAPPTTTEAQFTIDVLPFADFFNVPQLGCEPVSGSGCGGDGSIGDTIPDGLWRGGLGPFDGTTVAESTALEFDLWPYIGSVGEQMWEEFNAENPDYGSPPWDGREFMVNSNPRTRTVSLADDFAVRQAINVPSAPISGGYETRCVASVELPPVDVGAIPQGGPEAWLFIEGGTARFVLLGCPHD